MLTEMQGLTVDEAEALMAEAERAAAEVRVMEIDMRLDKLTAVRREADALALTMDTRRQLDVTITALKEERFGLWFGVLHPEQCSRGDGVEVAA
jgi:hypothetical protein